jgi:hypothetical protein
MPTLGTRREEHDVERVEPLRALGRAHGRMAVEHERPFLLAILVVVRGQRLARRELVDARAGPLRAQLLAETEHAGAEAVGIVRVIGELRIGDVDASHARDRLRRRAA